jgi:hypothetical protein
VGVEPVLIVARVTEHPVRLAVAFRIWQVAHSSGTPTWRHGAARAIHRLGLPILAIDDATSASEAAAHLLLIAHWHGYLADDGLATAQALAAAYPREVGWIRRGTGVPDEIAAASLLWERLLSPGFDPSRGAGNIRRYIKRQASTIVREQRDAAQTDHVWEQLGIKERHYYKLVSRFAEKAPDGRYVVDQQLLRRLRDHLSDTESSRNGRRAALDLLEGRGFSRVAARKWLQRHDLRSIASARPRGRSVPALLKAGRSQAPIASATCLQLRSWTPSNRLK